MSKRREVFMTTELFLQQVLSWRRVDGVVLLGVEVNHRQGTVHLFLEDTLNQKADEVPEGNMPRPVPLRDFVGER